MSGLYTFFKRYLPDGTKAADVELELLSRSTASASAVSATSADSDDQSRSSKYYSGYKLALRRIREREEEEEDAADAVVGKKDANTERQDKERQNQSEEEENEQNEGEEEEEEEEEFGLLTLNYEDWKKERKHEVRYVLAMRYDTKESVASDWVESSANQESDDENESEKLQSQPEQPPQDSQKNVASKEAPTLHRAVHTITRMKDLDLYTKEMTFDLCRVEKVWPLRGTKRAASRQFSDNETSCTLLYGRVNRIPFNFNEEDGLMAPYYDEVLSLEVVQLASSTNPSQEPNLTAAGGDAPTVSCSTSCLPKHEQRLKVFLYGQYAVSMQHWIEKLKGHNKQGPILMSFRNVPGVCVVPFTPHHQNWLDKDTLQRHCLIIGGASSFDLKGYNGIIRFDKMPFDEGEASTSLELRATTAAAAADSSKETTSELVLSPENMENKMGDDISFMTSSPSSLLQTYRDWKETEANIQSEANRKKQSEPRSASRAAEDMTITRAANADRDDGAASAGTDKQNQASAAIEDSSMRSSSRKKRPLSGDGGDIDDSANAADSLPRERNIIAMAGDRRNEPENNNRASSTRLPASAADVRQAKRSRTEQRGTREPASRAHTSDALIYNKVSELREMIEANKPKKTYVNIYGVVMGFTSPALTKNKKSNSWSMTVSIVDDSMASPGDMPNGNGDPPITLIIFRPKREDFPRLQQAGDVLRMHRVEAQVYEHNLQLVGFNGRSFVVCREKKFFPAANQDYTFDKDKDETRALNLWNWGQTRIQSSPTIRAESRFTIQQMESQILFGNVDQPVESNYHRDLTVLVSAKLPMPAENINAYSPVGFLRVWDGTGGPNNDGSPHDAIQIDTSARDPPISALDALSRATKELKTGTGFANWSDIEAPDRFCGHVVNVAIWEPENWDYIESNVEVGSFLRLRNVSHELLAGFRSWCLHVKSNSWLSVVPNKTYEVRTLLEEHHLRILHDEPFNQAGAVHIPLEGARCIGDDEGLYSFVNQPGLGRYTGIVTIKADVVSSWHTSRFCLRKLDGSGYSYRFGLKLQDKSFIYSQGKDHVQVIVRNSVGERVFGMPASEARKCDYDVLHHNIFRDDVEWKVTLQSVEHSGKRYFVATNLSRIIPM